ncbi:MAG: glycosyltransferase [Leptolyngbyaceae cyanobacterium CAN_BIN12]|nr:glycosyltransferase [Leptolyngbyaceae cyanobacterium CAN_BIN12]
MEPLVSVVIPTYQRPELVKRAVNSVLNQTLSQIEVIVVINGGDGEPTQRSLAEIADPRLRIIQLPVNLGNAAPARNAGCEAAQAKWVAHLDDDDEWMPEKLERQYEAATRSAHTFPIVSHYLTVRTAEGDSILPRRVPTQSEHISEYLFVRKDSYSFGEGVIQGSTLFTSKELMLKVPFSTDAHKHDDWDWILHACAVEGAGVEFVSEVLSIWYLDNQHTSISRTHNWQRSLDWIRLNRSLVTPRAYSSFLLVEVSSHAAFNPSWQAFSLLLRESIRIGKPRLKDLLLFLGMWTIPVNMRRLRVRNFFAEKRSPQLSEPSI